MTAHSSSSSARIKTRPATRVGLGDFSNVLPTSHPFSDAEVRRFLARVLVGDGCWGWDGAGRGSYGRCQAQGKLQVASRMSWMIFCGEIPSGMNVCHHCDNPECTRPDHLFLDSQASNLEDAYFKGRLKTGMRGRAKLTDEQVREIRERSVTEKISARKLATQYGVTGSTISRLLRGKHYGVIT